MPPEIQMRLYGNVLLPGQTHEEAMRAQERGEDPYDVHDAKLDAETRERAAEVHETQQGNLSTQFKDA
jgi:hypothetical protein